MTTRRGKKCCQIYTAGRKIAVTRRSLRGKTSIARKEVNKKNITRNSTKTLSYKILYLKTTKEKYYQKVTGKTNIGNKINVKISVGEGRKM